MGPDFSLIVLTYNEAMHLPRLYRSIRELKALVYVLDSGSNDDTLAICREFGWATAVHPFENHARQWDVALRLFNIETPWIICLDADQFLSPGLYVMLRDFKNENFTGINGIYFNRKYFFQGRQIRYGGYSPMYLLKMFRKGVGYSDLNENMDHRFVITGRSVTWKHVFLLEENLKENAIRFWIDKHNRYSDLVACEEVERMRGLRKQVNARRFFGNPDERRAYLKMIWWQSPLYFRAGWYFAFRMIFQLGILDGKTGILFHFLQAFWFRLLVDMKIEEVLSREKQAQ